MAAQVGGIMLVTPCFQGTRMRVMWGLGVQRSDKIYLPDDFKCQEKVVIHQLKDPRKD